MIIADTFDRLSRHRNLFPISLPWKIRKDLGNRSHNLQGRYFLYLESLLSSKFLIVTFNSEMRFTYVGIFQNKGAVTSR